MIRLYSLTLTALTLLAPPVAAQSGVARAHAALMATEVKLASPPNVSNDYGSSVAVDGNFAVVGSPQDDAAYFFRRSADRTSWILETTDKGEAGSQYGASVAIDGEVVLVGAPTFTVGSARVGRVTVLQREPVFGTEFAWFPLVTVLPPADQQQDLSKFGMSVALVGPRMVVGAPEFDVGTDQNVGRAYVFTQEDGGDTVPWNLTATLSRTAPTFLFGNAVAASGDRAIVGARAEEDAQGNRSAGRAYIYERSGEDWSLDAALSGSTTTGGDDFGRSVDIDGGTAAVGAPGDNADGGASNGTVTVFSLDSAGNWTEAAVLSGSTENSSSLGRSVAVSEESRVVAGSPRTGIATEGGGINGGSGAVRVFDKRNGVWALSETLTASDATVASGFGESLAFDGVSVIVGAPLVKSVYVYAGFNPVASEDAPDAGFALGAPRPNPATRRAALALADRPPQRVRADLVDALGRRVRTLFDGAASGAVDLAVELGGLAPGVYAVWVRGETASAVRRLTVVR